MSILLSGKRNQRTRLVVLGLDGLPLSLARHLSPLLPNIGRLTQEASTVRAELPELSPVNWTSFFTGAGPGKHGVYGFATMNPQTYESTVASSDHVRCPTIFDTLGEAGFVSRVINLPNTSPAKPIRGMSVGGFVAESLETACHPPFLAARLAELGYRIEPDTLNAANEPEAFFRGLHDSLRHRKSALDMLWPDLAWDLFVMVFTETDRLFHFHYPALENTSDPMHIHALAFMAALDNAVGDVLARYDALPEPKRLMVMADHGFTTLEQEVDLNALLKSMGLLSLSGTPAGEWDSSCISAATKAFALDPGRIYIHRSSRFARGTVSDAEAEVLIPMLQERLSGLTFEGRQVIEKVFTGQELYSGPEACNAPDLVCQPCPGFDLKAKFDRDDIFGFFGRRGTHTVEGAIFADTLGARPERMRDIGQLVLQHFGITG